jgi:hypothetical protein
VEKWKIGDIVYHKRRAQDDHNSCGEVVGYCPGDRWIKVKSDGPTILIWLRNNVVNIDLECRDAEYRNAVADR